MIIQLRNYTNVLIIKTTLSQNHNLLFKSDCHTENIVIYAYIVDHTLLTVQVQNDLNVSLIISWKICLDHVVKYKVNRYYLVNLQNSEFAVFTIKKWINWVRMCFWSLLIIMMTFYLRMMTSSERKIMHKVMIYEFNVIATQITIVMHLYFHL